MSEAKNQLLGVLSEATSQDYYRIKQAEDMLKQWENAPTFFATLQVTSMSFSSLPILTTRVFRIYFMIEQLLKT